MPPRLKPTGCYPMTVTAGVECGAYGKVNHRMGLTSRSSPAGWKACA